MVESPHKNPWPTYGLRGVFFSAHTISCVSTSLFMVLTAMPSPSCGRAGSLTRKMTILISQSISIEKAKCRLCEVTVLEAVTLPLLSDGTLGWDYDIHKYMEGYADKETIPKDASCIQLSHTCPRCIYNTALKVAVLSHPSNYQL